MMGPTQLALDSNAIATAVEDGEKRKVRRLLLTDHRFRSRSKIEAIEVALETVDNLMAVQLGNGNGLTGPEAVNAAHRIVRTLIGCLHDEP